MIPEMCQTLLVKHTHVKNALIPILQGVSVAASPVLAIVGSRLSVCLSVRLSVRHTQALSENDAS